MYWSGTSGHFVLFYWSNRVSSDNNSILVNTVPFFHWNGPERPGTLRKREMELTVAPFQSFRYRSGPGCDPVVLRSSVVQVVKLTADWTVKL